MTALSNDDFQGLADEGGVPATALEKARSELAEKWGHEPAPAVATPRWNMWSRYSHRMASSVARVTIRATGHTSTVVHYGIFK